MWCRSYHSLLYLKTTNLMNYNNNLHNNQILCRLFLTSASASSSLLSMNDRIINRPKTWSQNIPTSACRESYHTQTNDNRRILSLNQYQQHHQQQQLQNQPWNYTIKRYKHSQTQIKRLFKNHPARLRVEKRLWNIDRKQPRILDPQQHEHEQQQDNFDIVPTSESAITTTTTSATETIDDSNLVNKETESITQNQVSSSLSLLYPSIYTPKTILPNGWFEPMDTKLRPIYPFHISRTKNKPKDTIGFLPIYTKYRKDGTKIVTRIKKVTGNMDIFIRELRIVLSLPQPANQLQSYDDIKYRTGNIIEIQGHRANEIRHWLGGLGF